GGRLGGGFGGRFGAGPARRPAHHALRATRAAADRRPIERDNEPRWRMATSHVMDLGIFAYHAGHVKTVESEFRGIRFSA
ncbi:hypothetical protein, partial [Rhodoplanes sp. SY1]|uniref:hypothetical protein n=1 Tax=Rhodoplanes sp. SY1 TaxID=3166646 RepID=UPI0038B60452